MNLGVVGDPKHRLEPYALLPNESSHPTLCGLAHVAQSAYIALREPQLVVKHINDIGANDKTHTGYHALGVIVVVGILHQLQNKVSARIMKNIAA